MYQHVLPGAPASVESAESWMRAVVPRHLAPITSQAALAVRDLAANAVATITEGGNLTFTATFDETALRVKLTYPWKPRRAGATPPLLYATGLDIEALTIRRNEDTRTVEAEIEIRLPELAAAS